MMYLEDVDAWEADSEDDCLCPECMEHVGLGYHFCSFCGIPVNVCMITDNGVTRWLVTKETDEMGRLNAEEGTSLDVPPVFMDASGQ